MLSLLAACGQASEPPRYAAPEGTFQCASDSVVACEEQCKKGHPGSCVSAGENAATSSPEHAYELFVQACKWENGRGCGRAADVLDTRLGRKTVERCTGLVSAPEVRNLREIGCERLHDSVTCRDYVSKAPGGCETKDIANGTRELGRACSAGDTEACMHCTAAILHPEAHDMNEAAFYGNKDCFKLGCERGDPFACAAYAVGHEDWYRHTDDVVAFFRALKDACNKGNDEACDKMIPMGKRALALAQKSAAESASSTSTDTTSTVDTSRGRAFLGGATAKPDILGGTSWQEPTPVARPEQPAPAAPTENYKPPPERTRVCQERRCIGTAVGNGNMCTSWATFAALCR